MKKKITRNQLMLVIEIIIALVAVMALIVSILDHNLASKVGNSSNYSIDGVFPIEVKNSDDSSSKVIYPDYGTWQDALEKEFLFGFATKLHLTNPSDNTLPFSKVSIHADNIRPNLLPFLTGSCGFKIVGETSDTSELLILFKNEGWATANDLKIFVMLEKGGEDEEEPERVFGWREKTFDCESLSAGQANVLQILRIEDVQIDIEYEHYYHVDIYYSSKEIPKTYLTGCGLLVDESGFGYTGGGEISDRNEGSVNLVLTIPTKNTQYSRDYYADDMASLKIPANDSGFFNFLIFPEKSCQLDVWFEITLIDGKVLTTEKVRNIRVRVPFYENSGFLSIDGSDPEKTGLLELYGDKKNVFTMYERF